MCIKDVMSCSSCCSNMFLALAYRVSHTADSILEKKSHVKLLKLRTVPTIVTVHTFCASRDTRVSYG